MGAVSEREREDIILERAKWKFIDSNQGQEHPRRETKVSFNISRLG